MSSSQPTTNNNLMGFSVHQPAVGAALQFFPAMGSKQLDEMIDAYVPGNASILDKRTVVTCEFVQHSIATGELFKFFMVYPSHASDSFESPVSLQDSAYGSFNTSPVMSESQWANTSASSSSKAPSPTKKSTAADFSHIPGMKIMTREGIDVTNSASRGCKTKEQRDHAHLMRIIKACEACRKKKIRCDPSHKKRSSHSLSPEPKASKKARKSSPVAPKATPQVPVSNQSASFAPMPFAGMQGPPAEANNPSQWDAPSFDTAFVPADEVDIFAEMENWDQFINYGDESATVQNDWSFNADQFSPATTFTNSTSPSQPRTPAMPELASNGFGFVSAADFTANGGADYSDVFASGESAPALPYLNPGGVERNRNYIDFNLYSPGSSCDGEIGYTKDIAAASPRQAASPPHAAAPRQESSQYLNHVDRGDHVDSGDTNLPYDRPDGNRHKVVTDGPQAEFSQAHKPVHPDPSQAFAAGADQATTAAGAAMATALSSLHEHARSSPRLGADVALYTGLARPDDQQVPTDQRSHLLISPDIPVTPDRPRGDVRDEPRREREERGGRRSARRGEPSIAQTSRVAFDQSRAALSSSQTRLETSTASSHVSPDPAYASRLARGSEVAMHDSTELRSSSRSPQQFVGSSQYLSRTLATTPDWHTDGSDARIVLGGRTAPMPQPGAIDSAVPGLHGTATRTSTGGSLSKQLFESQLPETTAIKSHYRSQESSVIQEALRYSCSIINSSNTDKTSNIAIAGLITALSDTVQSMRTSDVAIQQPMLIASLFAATLLWFMPGHNAHSDSEKIGQLQTDESARKISTGEGWMAKLAWRSPQTSTTVSYLAALILALVAMTLLHIVAPIVVLAMTSLVLLQIILPCTVNLTAHTQCSILSSGSRIQAFCSGRTEGLGAVVCDLAKCLSQIHSNVGRKLSLQSPNQLIPGGSWQRLIL